MLPEEFYLQMVEIKQRCFDEDDDEEQCHRSMDNLICSVMIELGYSDGIDVFKNTPKWYA